MGLKNTWTPKVDGEDYILAEHINSVAQQAIDNEISLSEHEKRLASIDYALNGNIIENEQKTSTLPGVEFTQNVLPYACLSKMYGDNYTRERNLFTKYTITSENYSSFRMFTNADMSVIVTGKMASGWYRFWFIRKTEGFTIPKGRYTFSGCPKGGAKGKYCLVLAFLKGDTVADEIYDYGDPEGVTFDTPEDYDTVTLSFIIGGTNSVVFYPQLERNDDLHVGRTEYEKYMTRPIPCPKSLNVVSKNLAARHMCCYCYSEDADISVSGNKITLTVKSTSTASTVSFGIYCYGLGDISNVLNTTAGTCSFVLLKNGVDSDFSGKLTDTRTGNILKTMSPQYSTHYEDDGYEHIHYELKTTFEVGDDYSIGFNGVWRCGTERSATFYCGIFPQQYYEVENYTYDDIVASCHEDYVYELPQQLSELDGYGLGVYDKNGKLFANYIDFEEKKYYKCIEGRDYKPVKKDDNYICSNIDSTTDFYVLDPEVTDLPYLDDFIININKNDSIVFAKNSAQEYDGIWYAPELIPHEFKKVINYQHKKETGI